MEDIQKMHGSRNTMVRKAVKSLEWFLSSMVGEMILGSRANLREQEGKLFKVPLLRKD